MKAINRVWNEVKCDGCNEVIPDGQQVFHCDEGTTTLCENCFDDGDATYERVKDERLGL